MANKVLREAEQAGADADHGCWIPLRARIVSSLKEACWSLGVSACSRSLLDAIDQLVSRDADPAVLKIHSNYIWPIFHLACLLDVRGFAL